MLIYYFYSYLALPSIYSNQLGIYITIKFQVNVLMINALCNIILINTNSNIKFIFWADDVFPTPTHHIHHVIDFLITLISIHQSINQSIAMEFTLIIWHYGIEQSNFISILSFNLSNNFKILIFNDEALFFLVISIIFFNFLVSMTN